MFLGICSLPLLLWPQVEAWLLGKQQLTGMENTAVVLTFEVLISENTTTPALLGLLFQKILPQNDKTIQNLLRYTYHPTKSIHITLDPYCGLWNNPPFFSGSHFFIPPKRPKPGARILFIAQFTTRLHQPQSVSAAAVCIGACCRAVAWQPSLAVLHSIEVPGGYVWKQRFLW